MIKVIAIPSVTVSFLFAELQKSLAPSCPAVPYDSHTFSKRIIKSLTEDKDEKASLLRSEDMTIVEGHRTISNASKGKLRMGLSNFDTAGLASQGHYR